jgi:hypothetical protein
LKPIESIYVRAIKAVLGVRVTTCTDVCLLESGYPRLKAYIQNKRSAYLKKNITYLQDCDPLKLALDISRQANTKGYRFIMKALREEGDCTKGDIEALQLGIRRKAGDSSKRRFYLSVNPSGAVHEVYNLNENYVDEFCRAAFTKLRVGGHSLCIEMGRCVVDWGRLPADRVSPQGNRPDQVRTFQRPTEGYTLSSQRALGSGDQSGRSRTDPEASVG